MNTHPLTTKFLVVACMILVHGFNVSGSPVYDVRDFGARGDSVTLETTAIQNAIDRAWLEGGGTVFVPPGIYRIGGLVLKDNINLMIDAGATLLGSADLNDYIEIDQIYDSRTKGLYAKYFMLFAEDAENISITGKGIIFGNGMDNFQQGHPQNQRPFMIRLVNCRNVTIRDVNMLEPANWSCHLLGCRNVVVEGVRMENHTPGNGDGLDIDASRLVRVSNCFFDTVDDAIVLKSTCDSICSDVTITNCNITSKHGSALKTGTESNGGFKNISISNCSIRDTPRYAGIEFMTVDGGVMENITVTNIVMENVGSPIFLQLGNRARPFKSGQYVDHVSTVQDISFSHIYVDHATMPVMVSGLRARRISNISFLDISVKYHGTIDTDPMAANEVPWEETAYPMCTMYGKNLPAYGFYGRNFENATFRDVRFYAGSEYEKRPAMVFDHVSGIELDKIKASVMPATRAMILLRASEGVIIDRARSLGANKTLIIQETNCGNLVLNNNILQPGQTESRTVEATGEVYLFDDFEADTKIQVDPAAVTGDIPGHSLSEGVVRERFEVKKGKVYQVSVLAFNRGGLPEKLVVGYQGIRQEFLVDWETWGWAPVTLTKVFSEDQVLTLELSPEKQQSGLVISKVYFRPLNLGYTD